MVLWLFSELACVQSFATQVALVLSLITIHVFLLLGLDLDLLALFILNTYASAFLAITLISMQFVSFWGAVRQRTAALGVGSPVPTLWFGFILIIITANLTHLFGLAGWGGDFF